MPNSEITQQICACKWKVANNMHVYTVHTIYIQHTAKSVSVVVEESVVAPILLVMLRLLGEIPDSVDISYKREAANY